MKLKTKFQDEDFELGEVVDGVIVECLGKYEEKIRVIATAAKGGQHIFLYGSIKEFTDDWEDVPEEPESLGWHIGGYNEPEEIVFDEHLLKVSKWEKFKLWLWYRRDYKRITIWVRKEGE